MIATQQTLLTFIPICTLGILLFDLVLKLYNNGETISRAIVTSKPWVQILICIAQCVLILHFWSDWF